MKKHLSLLLSTLVIFSLISCNKEQQEQPVDSKDSSSLPILITSSLDTSSSSNEVPSSNPVISSEQNTSSEQQETYYHVVFVNYDNSPLYEADVLEGGTALYSGEEPVKAEDDEFTYEFDGWDKDLANIQSDTTFIAQFKAVAKESWGPIVWF